jgi:hypothetical protein
LAPALVVAAVRRIGGRAHVEGNVITTGPVSGTRPEAIRIVNIGSYVIARNVIHSQWPDPDAYISISQRHQFRICARLSRF